MPKTRVQQGRSGALEEARELVSLIASLEDGGDFVNAQAVQRRLGCSPERAHKLLLLLLNATSGGSRLPLATEGDEEYTLLSGAPGALHGRRLRLTAAETAALLAALDELGVEQDDPLRAKLAGALAHSEVDQALLSQVRASGAGGEIAQLIGLASSAIAAHRGLVFNYLKDGAGKPERRRVLPESIRQKDGAWYLDCTDLDRDGERTFRLDRMSEARVVAGAESADPAGTSPSAADPAVQPARSASRLINLWFDDAAYLQLFEWPDLALDASPREGYTASGSMPYFGGMWLPRQIAACGGAAHTDDPEVSSLTVSYARRMLANTR